jgi:hypothetical protein
MKFHFLPVLATLACLPFQLDADYAADFDARAQLLLDWVADHYQPPGGSNTYNDGGIPDPEKYTGPKMLARFTKYGPNDPAGAVRGAFPYPPVNTNANTWFDEGAKKRNFFHFRFVAPASIIWKFPDAPAVADHMVTYLGGNSDPRIQKDFVFKRQDNYNAFTGEGTENHINMNRTSGYLFAAKAAQLYASDPGAYPNFATAAARLAGMRQWILDWSKRVYEVGFGEWDSATYAVFNIIGWVQVHDLSGADHIDDPEVRAAARAVLDLYAGALAMKRSQGQMGGAESRANRNYGKMADGTAYLSWLWFAEGGGAPPGGLPASPTGNSNAAYALYAAISDYRPPMAAVELARKQFDAPETYLALKPSYLLREPGQAVEVFHAGPGYTLGSANISIGGFSAATWQYVTWKLLSDTPGGDFPKVVWGNGGYYGARGNTKDPFDQLVQHRNVLIQMSRVPANASTLANAVYALYPGWSTAWNSDFQARFAERDYGGWGSGTPVNSQPGSVTNALSSHLLYDSSTTRVEGAGAQFLQVNDTYLAVMSIRLGMPLTGTNQLRDSGDHDQLIGLVIEVGSKAEHGSLAGFRALVEASLAAGALDRSAIDTAGAIAYTSLSGDTISATYAASGEWTEPDYDWDFGVTTAGGVTTMHQHDWRQPEWPSGAGHGRQPAWIVNGVPQNPAEWAVYSGPRMRLAGARLEFRRDGQIEHVVDYSGSAPVFNSFPPRLRIQATTGAMEVRFPAPASSDDVSLEHSADLSGWTDVDLSGISTDGPEWTYPAGPPAPGEAGFYRLKTTAP